MSFKISITAESAADAREKITALAIQFGLEVGPRVEQAVSSATLAATAAKNAAPSAPAPRPRGRPPSAAKQAAKTEAPISQTPTARAAAPSTEPAAPAVEVSSPRVSSDEGFKPTKAELVDVLKQVMVKVQPEDVKKMMIAAVGVGKISEVPEDKYLALYQACEAKLAELAA